MIYSKRKHRIVFLLGIIILINLQGVLYAQTDLLISDEVVVYANMDNYNVTVNGISELHITATTDALSNSSINLSSEGAWLYFDNAKPSEVLGSYLGHIQVNGAAAVLNSNIRIRNYRIGTLLIPHAPNYKPLEVFDGEVFSGSSMKMNTFTFYRSEATSDDVDITYPIVMLDAYSDNISSFKLKRGYMATFAQSSDGTGYSRVYVADREDVEIPIMPEGLKGDVSFVRVFPWNYPSKKGFTYESGTQQLDGDWFYNWGAGSSSTNNVEFVPMKWGGGYAGKTFLNKSDATHLLGFNEPSHVEQSNLSVDQAIKYWSSLQKSGLRLGSLGIADNGKSWLYEFMEKADQLNFRIDFVAVHYYQGGKTALQMYNWLKDVHDRTGRPIWITEWNNGATWTNEGDPTYEEQAADVSAMIAMMDTTSWIERYAIYNWVEAVRAVIDSDKNLTLAGEVYKDKRSPLAYNPDKDFYLDYMGLTEPFGISATNETDGVHLDWMENVSGDEGVIIERAEDGGDFSEIIRVEGNEIVTYIDASLSGPGAYQYRLKYYNSTEESAYSETVEINILPENVFNVTVSMPVAVDSYHSADYKGPGAVDSDNRPNSSSRWVSANTAFPHWIEVDLKDTFNISWLSFYTGLDSYSRPIFDFELMYWDITEKVWKSALSVSDNDKSVFHSAFPEVTTNKVKLIGSRASDNYFRLFEIEVFGTPYNEEMPINVALYKPATASSQHSSGKYPPRDAVDGNNNFDNTSRWVSGDGGYPQWMEIDLKGTYTIERLKMVMGEYDKEGPFFDFNFNYWNNDQWIELCSVIGNTNLTYEHVFDEVNTTKVRLNVLAGPSVVRLHEIEVYGLETKEIDTTAIDDRYRNSTSNSIYPNPANHEIHIKNLTAPTQVTVFDQLGRAILSHKTTGKIDIQYLKNGMYFMSIEYQGVFKFIKN